MSEAAVFDHLVARLGPLVLKGAPDGTDQVEILQAYRKRLARSYPAQIAQYENQPELLASLISGLEVPFLSRSFGGRLVELKFAALRGQIVALQGDAYHLALAYLQTGQISESLGLREREVRAAMLLLRAQADPYETERIFWERAWSEIQLDLAFAGGDASRMSLRLAQANRNYFM